MKTFVSFFFSFSWLKLITTYVSSKFSWKHLFHILLFLMIKAYKNIIQILIQSLNFMKMKTQVTRLSDLGIDEAACLVVGHYQGKKHITQSPDTILVIVPPKWGKNPLPLHIMLVLCGLRFINLSILQRFKAKASSDYRFHLSFSYVYDPFLQFQRFLIRRISFVSSRLVFYKQWC